MSLHINVVSLVDIEDFSINPGEVNDMTLENVVPRIFPDHLVDMDTSDGPPICSRLKIFKLERIHADGRIESVAKETLLSSVFQLMQDPGVDITLRYTIN